MKQFAFLIIFLFAFQPAANVLFPGQIDLVKMKKEEEERRKKTKKSKYTFTNNDLTGTRSSKDKSRAYITEENAENSQTKESNNAEGYDNYVPKRVESEVDESGGRENRKKELQNSKDKIEKDLKKDQSKGDKKE